MRSGALAGIIVIGVALALSTLAEGVPPIINYQGRLLDENGLVNGTRGVSFRLYNAPSGGATLYEDSNSVVVVDGLYSALIGDQTNVGNFASALTNQAVWMETAINGVALSPRERITSSAYAISAQNAESLGGLAASSYATGTPVYGVGNLVPVYAPRGTISSFNYQGNSVNEMTARIGFFSTNRTFAVMGLYADYADNELSGVPTGMELWTYNRTSTVPFAADTGSPILAGGVHNASIARWQWAIYGRARGTNDWAHDMIIAIPSPATSNFPERVRITTEGDLVVSNAIRAGYFGGNGAGLSNLNAQAITNAAQVWTNVFLSQDSARAGYWQIVAAPALPTSPGEPGQLATDSTNIYVYLPASGLWLRVSGTLEW